MNGASSHDSACKVELLDDAYGYVSERGLTDLSLRPLAATTGTSPPVLLYLFGSKDGLIAAILNRTRTDELSLLSSLAAAGDDRLAEIGEAIWNWLTRPEHRGLLNLWAESYSRSLIDPAGPWAGFAATSVRDWLAVFEDGRPEPLRQTPRGGA